MNKEILAQTAKELVAPGKGILAADESTGTIKKRFEKIGVESTPESNRIYRQLLFKTKGIEESISGVIMFDETIRQKTDEGVPFPKYLAERGIIPGIKVDKGKIDMPDHPGEKITQGIEGLPERLAEYKKLGARFTKWRAVITIGNGIPSDDCIESNAELLAKFALHSQDQDLVPIVEPEVLTDGNHDITRNEHVTYQTLKVVFAKLSDHGVSFSGMLLKPNWVHPGKDSGQKPKDKEVAEATLRVMREAVLPEVQGIVFLSGGANPEASTSYLNAMNEIGGVPWELSFSFGRALQQPVLESWQGKPDSVDEAQKAFYKRGKLNSLARAGEYKKEMEKDHA
ncbi:MAG: class I fructose-bisphosphate aldolase [Patescibacteria group bacterium]